ncbi:sigma-70 family RNA polymerase sigma factor [Anderseniella sp. Alg231-50]|uniref:sigma-70 family RNA polymerase sigma factor n=1 Tax=Anderseniella sp. Alg231-50 TaxID=1922226 RepID=UPI000D550208
MNWQVARPAWGMAGYSENTADSSTAGDASPAVDAVLLEGVVAGDESAFATLVDRHYSLVFRLSARVLGNAADAEDVTQEAFVKLWRDPPVLRNQAALKGWIVRVARNLAIDRLRRARNTSDSELELLVDPSTAPDGHLRHGQAADEVSAAMAQLPERQRTALQLTYFEALGNQETASIMEVSVEAVESLLSRARRSLRTLLNPVWTDLIDELEQLK